MIKEILEKNEKIIGFWGYPEPEKLKEIKKIYPNHSFLDLDVNYKLPKSGALPDAYCQIITNIIDNSIYLKNNLELILASTGEEKCDAGRFAAKILKEKNFNIIETKFTDYPDTDYALPICQSNLPLTDKINTIMNEVISHSKRDFKPIKPTHGFWGVPPNDFGILGLFPESTHVYGWTRCVEAKRPADIDLEMYVNENIPTVFYAQTFCAKMQLAKYLAKKHNGLYVDVDDIASNSVKAKIEAFIRLG